jgi:hypothetical protein
VHTAVTRAAIRRAVIPSAALALVIGTTVASGAVGTRPTVLDGATLVFEADGLDGAAGTAVLVGETVVDTVDVDLDGFAEHRVPLPAALLSSGRVDVTLLAGTESAELGLDEFDVRDVRLVLGEGDDERVVAVDQRYEAGRPYRMGDGRDPDGRWGNPLAVAGLPIDRLGHVPGSADVVELRTPQVATRTFRFEVPADGAPSGAPSLPLLEAAAGAGLSKPFDATPGVTEVGLQTVDGRAVAQADGDLLETVPDDGFATQTFTFDASGVDADHLEVAWQGATLPGRGAALYAWDVEAERWTPIATTAEAGSTTALTGVVDTATTVGDDGRILLQVQEAPYDDADTDFAFAWITDTQFYSERYADTYDDMTTWIARNARDEKIIYAVHTGDITQNYNGPPEEWARASASMAILEDAGVPYGITTGNHDLWLDGRRDGLQFDQTFPVSRFEDMASEHVRFGGAFDGYQNHFDVVEHGDVRLIVLYLAHGTDAEDIAWANQVIAEHPDHQVILATHQYISGSGAYGGTAQSVLTEVIVPNDNVVMMLCGHYTGGIYNVRRYPTAEGGQRVVFEVLQDYQGGDDGGNGYLQLLRFDTDGQQMDIWPYSPTVDEFDNGGDSGAADRIAETGDDVTLPTAFGEVERRVATDRIAVGPVG